MRISRKCSIKFSNQNFITFNSSNVLHINHPHLRAHGNASFIAVCVSVYVCIYAQRVMINRTGDHSSNKRNYLWNFLFENFQCLISFHLKAKANNFKVVPATLYENSWVWNCLPLNALCVCTCVLLSVVWGALSFHLPALSSQQATERRRRTEYLTVPVACWTKQEGIWGPCSLKKHMGAPRLRHSSKLVTFYLLLNLN